MKNHLTFYNMRIIQLIGFRGDLKLSKEPKGKVSQCSCLLAIPDPSGSIDEDESEDAYIYMSLVSCHGS